MEHRLEKGGALAFSGFSIETRANGENFHAIPAFWDAVMADGRFEALRRAAPPLSLGVCGVCRNFDMSNGPFTYSIAVQTPADRSLLPPLCGDFTVPASTWAKFVARGPLRPTLQDTIERIYGEWFPTSGREHAGTAEIEFYPAPVDPRSPDYWCEYWIPLK